MMKHGALIDLRATAAGKNISNQSNHPICMYCPFKWNIFAKKYFDKHAHVRPDLVASEAHRSGVVRGSECQRHLLEDHLARADVARGHHVSG